MKKSRDMDVVLFRTEYKDILDELAKDNTILGTYKSLAPEPTKLVSSNHFSILLSTDSKWEYGWYRIHADPIGIVRKFLV